MTVQPEDINVVSEVNCMNSPKKELLCDLNSSVVKQQLEEPLNWLEEEIEWEIVEDETVQGLRAVEEKLQTFLNIPIQEFHIDHIITHGKTAALNGNGEVIELCHIYLFKGHKKTAKIKEMISYIIETNK